MTTHSPHAIYDLFDYRDKNQLPLWVDYVKYGIHPERSFHSHRFSEIVLIKSGPARHLLETFDCVINRFDVLVIPPGFTHAYDQCDQLELLNIVYDHQKLAMPFLDAFHLPLFFRLFPVENTEISAEMAVNPVLRLAEDEFESIWDDALKLNSEILGVSPGRRFLALALYMKIVAELARCESDCRRHEMGPEPINNIVEFMNHHLEENISMDALARRMGMSRRGFFRYFHNATGNSPLQYLLNLRLQRALHFLQHSNYSFNETASRCGFCDANYLARLCRNHLGKSPTELRKK